MTHWKSIQSTDCIVFILVGVNGRGQYVYVWNNFQIQRREINRIWMRNQSIGELTRLISCAIDRKDSLPSPSWRFNVRQCIEAMRIRSLAFSISCPLDVENSIRTSSSSRTFAGGNIYGNRRIMVGETRSFYLCLDDSRVLVYTLKQ